MTGRLPLRWHRRNPCRQHLADVHGVDRGPAWGRRKTIRHHDHAERATRCDRLGTRREHLRGPVLVDTRAAGLFHPHPAAAGAAAERVLARLLHLGDRHARGAKHVPWRGDDVVVAGEVARVVDRDAPRPVIARLGPRLFRHRRQPPRRHEVRPGRRVVDDLVRLRRAARTRCRRVEAVRAGGHDGPSPFPYPSSVSRCPRRVSRRVFVARAPRRVAGARLLLAEDREAHPPRPGTSPPRERPSSSCRSPPRSRPSTGPRARRAAPPPPSMPPSGLRTHSDRVQSSRADAG